MGFISTDPGRSHFKLGFSRRGPLSERMRAAVSAVAASSYIDLVSEVWDFGLDKKVRFSLHSESAAIHADQLPTVMVAAREGGRDVVVLLYEADDIYVAAVVGSSFQAASALQRYLNYNLLSLEWVGDGAVAGTPSALRELYADPIDCIGGIDLVSDIAIVHQNRAYASDVHRPQALVDLIRARSDGRLADLELEAKDSRMARFFSGIPRFAPAQAMAFA